MDIDRAEARAGLAAGTWLVAALCSFCLCGVVDARLGEASSPLAFVPAWLCGGCLLALSWVAMRDVDGPSGRRLPGVTACVASAAVVLVVGVVGLFLGIVLLFWGGPVTASAVVGAAVVGIATVVARLQREACSPRPHLVVVTGLLLAWAWWFAIGWGMARDLPVLRSGIRLVTPTGVAVQCAVMVLSLWGAALALSRRV